jgi:uncharacterized membrane protein YhaH (DUF805 family)
MIEPALPTFTDESRIDPVIALFGFRGRIGRGGYWTGIAMMIVLMLAALGFAAAAVNPTGGGAPLLAIAVFLTALWVHAAVTVKRLRDMGYPAGLYGVIVVVMLVMMFADVEAIEAGGIMLFFFILVVLAVPGLIDKRANRDDTQPSG